jgi:hypothetical protein
MNVESTTSPEIKKDSYHLFTVNPLVQSKNTKLGEWLPF